MPSSNMIGMFESGPPPVGPSPILEFLSIMARVTIAVAVGLVLVGLAIWVLV